MAEAFLTALVTRVQELADRKDPGYRDRAIKALDEAIHWYSRRVPLDSLQEIETFLSDGTGTLALPQRVAKVIRVGDLGSRDKVQPGAHWEDRAPEAYYAQERGDAREWRELGVSPVLRQPATPATLTVFSTSSESMDVQIGGLAQDTLASGTALEFYEVRHTITLAGASEFTPAVARILSISKPRGTAAGVVVVQDTPIARLAPWETRSAYRKIQLLRVPAAGESFQIMYNRRPDRITSEDDTIDPAVDETALTWRAVGTLHWILNEPQVAQAAWQQAEGAVAAIREQEETHGEESYATQPAFSYRELEDDADIR